MSEASNQPQRANSLTPEMVEFASKMYDAARKGDTATFEQALPAGLPPNLTNDKGDTLLMLAAYHGHADLVKVLIQHGADSNRLNDRGQSPLAGAVFKKEDAVIQVSKLPTGHSAQSTEWSIEIRYTDNSVAEGVA
ncbi:hypothetical protein FPSE5266_01165 [Fusarium pseudograminearum]|nr:hypothetical protein FPSE5266_01165 [Fusarium pseudograminearum]